MEIQNKKDAKKFDKKAYDMEYHRTKIKRIPLNISLESYEIWKKYADLAGLPLNTFIKQAVQEKIDSMVSAGKADDTLL